MPFTPRGHLISKCLDDTSSSKTPFVLVAPDKFKGTFTSIEVANAISSGLQEAGQNVALLPAADGGDGTAEVIVSRLGGRLVDAFVTNACGDNIVASFGLAPEGFAIVDAAAASGLAGIHTKQLDPWHASTVGTGELIAVAATYVDHVIVACGGTATTDGGVGAVSVLRRLNPRPRLTIACDVSTPWERAARMFSPQKGAEGDLLNALEHRMDRIAGSLPRDPRGQAMTGCGGGLSGALWAEFDAELVRGADLTLDLCGFDELLADSALVITGEGRLDAQTCEGKLVQVVAARASARGIPCVAVVGKNALNTREVGLMCLADVVEARTLVEMQDVGRTIGSAWPVRSHS